MATEESQPQSQSQQQLTLADHCYDDPSQLSQLLRRRAAPHIPAYTTNAFISPTKAAQLHPAPRRVEVHSRYVKPALPNHNTAPTGTGFPRVSADAERLHHTFTGVMDAPGDTQPDSQIYRDWTSGVFDSRPTNNNTGPVAKSLLNDTPSHDEDADTQTDGAELTGSSQEQHSPAVTNPTIVPDDDAELQLRFTVPVTSPLKFQTPAMAGRKRDSQGHILTSGMRTATTTPRDGPDSSGLFGAGVGGEVMSNDMSLTQVFNATQAHTSPIVDAESEDAIFQRPSPNFTNARNSSPVPAMSMSSPLKQARSVGYSRSSSEPKGEYVTMQQSQERRGAPLHDQNDAIAQDSWEEPTVVERRAATRLARAQFDQEAEKSFAKVTAPSSSPPHARRKRRFLRSITKSPKHKTPVTSEINRHSAYHGPYGVVQDNEASESPDELSQPTPLIGHDGRNASPDDLLQAATSSVVEHKNTISNKVQVPNTSSHPSRPFSSRSTHITPPGSPSLRSQRNLQPRRPSSQIRLPGSLPKSSRGSIKIMDSQPDPIDARTVSRPKSLLIPSSPSTNQYSIDQTTLIRNTGYTSQVVSSSIPPMPPKTSSAISPSALDRNADIDNEPRVPSSPPGLGMEDIVYDEHCYDEHNSADEESEDHHSIHSIHSLHSTKHIEDDDELPRADIVDDAHQIPKPGRSSRTNEAIPESERVDDADVAENSERRRDADMDAGSRDVFNTAELPTMVDNSEDGDNLVRSSHPEEQQHSLYNRSMQPPRSQRQSTVPESDVMEDTKPSLFAQGDAVARANAHTAEPSYGKDAGPEAVDSNELYHTANEHQSAALSESGVNSTPQAVHAKHATLIPHFQSLQDIANLPNTQRSADNTDVEIPQLSFNDDGSEEVNVVLPRSLPVQTLAKKRRVTYSAKKMTYAHSGKEPAFKPRPVLCSPNNQSTVTDNTTPSSTLDREQQGSHAAAYARNEAVFAKSATLKADNPQKAKRVRSSKQGALKPVNKASFKTLPKTTQSYGLPEPSLHSSSPFTSTNDAKPTTAQVEVPLESVDDETDELAGPTPYPFNQPISVQIPSDHGETPTGGIVAPNRVIAFWPGLGFYPATCLGRADSRHLRVRYDDGSLHSLEPVQVRAMDLRVGDQVKVDEPGLKKHIYTIVGFKDKIDPISHFEHPMTDCHGYATAVLEVKQRDSLPKAQVVERSVMSAPMQKLYFTNVLWGRLGDRQYKLTPPPSPNASSSRAITPVCAPVESAPPSMHRRINVGQTVLKESAIRAVSVSSSVRLSHSRVFADMAFAITFTLESSDKDAITKLITSSGGHLLDDGFHELFRLHDDPLVPPSTMPTKGLADGTISAQEKLQLKEEYKELRFVALITDSHCRRTKYIQALALNIPCIHHRWLTDSVAAASPMEFGKYLLPAGLSTNLGREGVVRSRTMPLYDPGADNVLFSQILEGRPLLLSGERILLITGKTKKDVERKKPYLFLTLALGPANVAHCTDLAAAKRLLQQGQWGWVYVDGGASSVAEGGSMLFSDDRIKGTIGKGMKNKKKKKDTNEDYETLVKSGSINGKTVRIACDEFIVQSLILGALVEY